MKDTNSILETDINNMPNVDDLIKQQDTDAMKWALAFKRVIIENNFTMDDMKDESYMVGWFANAMMAQHDWMHNTNQLKEASEVVPNNHLELIEKLWQIIDDIDTIGDIAKDNDKAYRQMVEKKQKERWELPIECDGYKLYINEPMPYTVVDPASSNGDYACETTFQKVGDEIHVIDNKTTIPSSESEGTRPQCKIECEWDIGFEYIYDNYEEAVRAIEQVDWDEVGYDTWQEAEADGMLSIEEVQ